MKAPSWNVGSTVLWAKSCILYTTEEYCNAMNLNFHCLLLVHFAELMCNYKNTCVDTCIWLCLLALEENTTILGHQLGSLL